MSKDCNVKKFKAVVDNDNLVGIDEMLFEVNAPSGTAISERQLTLQTTGTKRTNIEVIGDGYITNNNGDNLGKTKYIDYGSPATTKFSTGTYKVKVDNKYNINAIQGEQNSKITFDYKYLHFSRVDTIYLIGITGEVKFNKIPNVFGVIGRNYYGSIDNLKDFNARSVTALECIRLTGNASSLKNINSSQYLCTFRASGTVESLVEARAARNVAGTVKMLLILATLNGKNAPQMDMVYTATGNCTIKSYATSTTVATYESGTWTYYGDYQ